MTMGLGTEVLVSATRRIAEQNGAALMVLRKGDPNSGSLFVKLNTLDGKALVLSRIWVDEEQVWAPIGHDSLTDREADALLSEQAEMDPDVWLIEIEDREGRLWFPGRVIPA